MDRWMAARPWENRHLDYLKDNSQNISLKLLETTTKNIKVDDASLKSSRPAIPQSLSLNSDTKPVKAHRLTGLTDHVPLPLPSPPVSDEDTLPKSELQLKSPVVKKLIPSSSKQEASRPAPSIPQVTIAPVTHDKLEMLPPSPTASNSPQSTFPETKTMASNSTELCVPEHGFDEELGNKATSHESTPGDCLICYVLCCAKMFTRWKKLIVVVALAKSFSGIVSSNKIPRKTQGPIRERTECVSSSRLSSSL